MNIDIFINNIPKSNTLVSTKDSGNTLSVNTLSVNTLSVNTLSVNTLSVNTLSVNNNEKYFLDLNIINPNDNILHNILTVNKNIIGVCYKTEYIIENIDTYILNNFYIIVKFKKNMSDIITNIMCDYKISIVYPNGSEIKITDKMIMTLPILFMIYCNFTFKIYFSDIQKFISDVKNKRVIIKYNSYTLSNECIIELNNCYKLYKSITNNLGMTIANGMIINEYDLDY